MVQREKLVQKTEQQLFILNSVRQILSNQHRLHSDFLRK
eukprot:SAG11_NODE_1250_length_5389_cov_12.806994_3_plen_39_part_00